MALSQNGLFSKTQEAADKYKQAQSDEEEMIRQITTQMYSEYIGVEVTGYTPTGTSCEIENTTSGYTDNQTFEKENLSWRIWDFDGTTLRIIGDPTTTTLYLNGVAGYNNGVWVMDHICKELYSNDEHGITATTLKRSDIQKVSTYDYTNFTNHPYSSTEKKYLEEIDTHFGESKTYENYNKYPEMWKINDQDWDYEYNGGKSSGKDKECLKWEAIGTGNMDNEKKDGDGKIEFKQSYYTHDYSSDEFISDSYYDLIFKKNDKKSLINTYWLGGRFVNLNYDYCVFGMDCVQIVDGNKNVSGSAMCHSDETNTGRNRGIRPLVSINLNDSKCTMTEEVGDDGSKHYKLSW